MGLELPERLTRVLFVDDEQRILDGLRLGLRQRRKQWEMVFVPSPQNALELLKQEPFDAVVTDMRMPRMDGAEFLAQVTSIQPETVRIVLSGQMDETAASRAAQVAHRFLAKPCDIATLDATIARTLAMRALLISPAIRVAIGGMGTLPSPPKTCLTLQRALHEEWSMSDVAQVVESDVAMASKVLQLVNSSFFGVPRTLASVAQAVAYLGVNSLRSLITAQAMFQAFAGVDARALERMQESSLLSARIARSLLKDRHQAEIAATAALLHDVGALALSTRLPAEYAALCRDATARGVPLERCEREQFGTTHAEVGAYLLGLWGLPFEVIEAVAQHHAELDEASALDVNTAVAIAVSVGTSLCLPPGDAERSATPVSDEVVERLGVRATLDAVKAEASSGRLVRA